MFEIATLIRKRQAEQDKAYQCCSAKLLSFMRSHNGFFAKGFVTVCVKNCREVTIGVRQRRALWNALRRFMSLYDEVMKL